MTDTDAVAVLYGLPLEEFTEARNELAKELRSRGDPKTAAAVRELKKPNLAAWALNQLSRRHAAEVDELLDLSDRLRRAQRRVLSGGSAEELRQLSAQRRRLVQQMTECAGEILTEGGHAASASTLKGVSDSLTAVAADEEGAEALGRGVLVRELKPGAVVDVGGLKIIPGGRAAGEAPRQAPTTPKELEAARKMLALAKSALADAEDQAETAEREVVDLEARADGSSRAAEELKDDVDEAVRAAEDAEEEARRARHRADELSEELAAAERRASSAQEALESARREAERLRAKAEETARTVAEAEELLRAAD